MGFDVREIRFANVCRCHKSHTSELRHRYLTSRNGIGNEQQLTPYRDTLRVVPEAPEAPEMT